ncbi:MAG: methylenetetrahydrofolate reductase [Ignavibacteriaceae bacterium]|jgi:5,10-methylenetetrahydrofolate reductase|nr:MAG: methylenetetrahydrofolate reductase [NAD(P)H] [Chlorobiota bacterium]KXK06222.1 MAG: 5,10-Methylenetetrahydrofolate reductase [Chlorobi bacterium OLB4]MBV6399265.1 5,10-methylenetetrahydrofolate reductase [Ignavibacteria bacterium]MCC6884938.1 methylenetetrahydrofolate reductase [Ignavibacteriales bacterium]MCE7953531.1 methylenetetrahydrofolate reductase [NAD(P)H] [Chlorobi bacterium CHB7]MDL1887579.1 methylenetetrahydrofolate reductase [NAD(P)H] [Ignavibacteria bacterium CHB1]MEB232
MKVTEHLENSTRPLISFEIIPLPRGGDIRQVFEIIDELIKFEPPFIDVTSHSAEVHYEETASGIRKKVKRKKPGTIGISVAIKNKYNIDTVPHLLCTGFTKEETEDALIELNYLGIENVLAIRGDDNGYIKPLTDGRTSNRYAIELVDQISKMNQGIYLDTELLNASPTNFCIGVGGYPEKHFESPNLSFDVEYAKKKVEAGAEYIVTQMFFDNKYYFDYVRRCRDAGITVPIIPGLKILFTQKHLTNIPKNFFVNIPEELSGEILKSKSEHAMEIGINWTLKQCEELLNNNVSSIHFYIMHNIKPVKKLMDKLKL